MDYAFKYIETGKLLETEANYPYTGKDGTCAYEASKGVANVKNYYDIQKTAAALKASVVKGPTSVAIEADQAAFQFYHGGIITKGCGQQLDHGVLVVGYGTDSGVDYFLVKNSWGAGWGVKGYVKIGTNNQCGILNEASRPIE